MKYNVKHLQIYLIFLCVVTFFSCKQGGKPNVDDIKVDIHIERFDRDLYAGKHKNLVETDLSLQKKYGFFYDDYIHRMVGDKSYTDQVILSTLYKDKAYTDLNTEADSVFRDMAPIEKDLNQTFKYIKYYYPKIKIPRFITFVSGFSVQTPIGDGYMGIGLDMFLGKNSKFYRAIIESVPLYLSRRFTPDYVVPRLTETFAREEMFPQRDEDHSLLAKMVENGKILYFMDKVLADEVPDTLKIGYTEKQLAWCKSFEGDIWAYLIENKLLFETDDQKIQMYVSEAPFTPGLGEKNESAPKLGVWIGWQMVRKYMAENPKVTLQELMKEQDPQKILNGAKYKPKMNSKV
ncbi:gliding motility lipoprotein GldB [Pedobacter cryoconitis]|uniref:Gliding motility-associated lipoprotein GldB n=1 Tax=Pedobacter cryoconitis TaxID=188932 RepID=A0A7X0J850_9SPHI|nr:gliding motility lipoprotein GldB [Pedobacter cryoconitis]MBB6502748.1 gliding motility-associated lipoprotein GldB [Pedobacter cryoconitis]